MWDLGNQTEFAADRCVISDKHGARHWVVVVKGTFDIAPDGSATLADEQPPPLPEPIYRGEPGESSLLYDVEMGPPKPRTDIVVNGSAHAPHGQPCTEMVVGLETPAGRKSLRVIGDRHYERNLMGLVEPSAPLPFTTMPIVYERAYGGFDKTDADPSKHRMFAHNPIGRGFFTSPLHRVGNPLPNLEAAGGDSAQTVGFGAVCSYWQPRLARQGTYDAKWINERRPLLPDDFDPLNLQCAPDDQQVQPHVRGGASIGLVGMRPEGALRFEVPRHFLAFSTQIGRARHEHRAKLDTIIVEADARQVVLIWRTILSRHHEIDDIDFTEIRELPYV